MDMNKQWRSLDGQFVDLKVLDLDMFFKVFGKHFYDCFLISFEANVGLISFNFFSPEQYIYAFAKICLEVANFIGHIMKFNECRFFFVEGVHFEAVFMQDDAVGAVVLKDVWIDFFKENLVYVLFEFTVFELGEFDVAFWAVDN